MLSRRGWAGRDRCVPLHVRRLFRQAFCAPEGLRCQAHVSEAAVALSVAPARVRQNKVGPPLPVRLSIVDHQGARHRCVVRDAPSSNVSSSSASSEEAIAST